MLLTFPSLEIESYNDNELPFETLQWYNDAIVAYYEAIKRNCIVYDDDMDIEPYIAKFDTSAQSEWKRIFNEITNVQNSDDENEYMKSMLPKQKSYIPRFALLIHTIDCYIKSKTLHDMLLITKESMLKAEKLSKYFIAMAKKIKVNSIEIGELKEVLTANKNKSLKEKFFEMYQKNPELNKKEAGELLSVSRQSIYDWIKEIEKKV